MKLFLIYFSNYVILKSHVLIWNNPLRDLHVLITWFHHATVWRDFFNRKRFNNILLMLKTSLRYYLISICCWKISFYLCFFFYLMSRIEQLSVSLKRKFYLTFECYSYFSYLNILDEIHIIKNCLHLFMSSKLQNVE